MDSQPKNGQKPDQAMENNETMTAEYGNDAERRESRVSDDALVLGLMWAIVVTILGLGSFLLVKETYGLLHGSGAHILKVEYRMYEKGHKMLLLEDCGDIKH